MTFLRPQASVVARRLAEPRRFLQTVAGPRQDWRERNQEVDFVAKAQAKGFHGVL